MIGGRGTGGLLYVYTSNTGWFLRKTYQTWKQKQGINFMRGIGVKELLARGDFPLPATFSSVTSHEWKKSRQAKITGWSMGLGDNVSSKQAIWSNRRLPWDWEISWPHIIKNTKLIRVLCYICCWYANFDLFSCAAWQLVPTILMLSQCNECCPILFHHFLKTGG